MEYIPGLDLDSVCLTKNNDVKAKNIMVCNERVVWIELSSSITLPHILGRGYDRSLIKDKSMVESVFFILSHVRARYFTGPFRFSTILTGPKLPINKVVCIVNAELLPSISSSDFRDEPYQYLFRPELNYGHACKVILETVGAPSEPPGNSPSFAENTPHTKITNKAVSRVVI